MVVVVSSRVAPGHAGRARLLYYGINSKWYSLPEGSLA